MEMRLNCVLWLQRVGVFKVFKQVFNKTQKTFRLKGSVKQNITPINTTLLLILHCNEVVVRLPLELPVKLPFEFATRRCPEIVPNLVSKISEVALEVVSKVDSEVCLQSWLQGHLRWCPATRQVALPVCPTRMFSMLLLSLPLSFLPAVASRLVLMLQCTEVVLKVVPQVES